VKSFIRLTSKLLSNIYLQRKSKSDVQKTSDFKSEVKMLLNSMLILVVSKY